MVQLFQTDESFILNGRKHTHTRTGAKLGSNFNIKGITKKEHKQVLVHSVKCPEETCSETYNGETGTRLIELIDEHKEKNQNSHVYQHSVNSNHALFFIPDNKYKGKILEALFIKSKRPNFSKQDSSASVKIFNWYFHIFEVE